MENLSNQLSNVSIYDVKKYVRKAQNAVLNVTEMEAKVREATNNDPWQASTSSMQVIAEGTNSYQHFHEIMPFLYRRFTEKAANEWRQIYKALQLLDFLVRNGSERVVDYARSHISVIEMLRHFSYTDSKFVDRGVSIRKLSGELVDLLQSNKELRAERKQAKKLNAKTMGASRSASSSAARFGGFGAPTGVYANTEVYDAMGGGFGGSGAKYGGLSSETFYKRQSASNSGSNASLERESEFDEYEVKTTKPSTAAATNDDDDDFAEFQSAPAPAPAPVSTNILDLFDMPSAPVKPSEPTQPTFDASVFGASQPASQPASQSASQPANQPASQPASQPAPAVDLFDSLWETSKTYTPAKPAAKPAPAPAAKPTPAAPQPKKEPQGNADIVDLLSF